MIPQVLVVEDEADLNRMVSDYLRAQGFEPLSASSGPEAIGTAFRSLPDIVLLDLNLPGVDGLDVARTITSQLGIPVVATTARGEEEERLAGFRAGVDDYVVKPFSLPELVMRIRAVLRRASGPAGRIDSASRQVVVGDVIIDPGRRSVTVAGREVSLTTAQFEIVARLAAHPGRVYTRLELLESFGDSEFDGYERTIDVHIKNIRKAIGEPAGAPKRILTVRGVGYRLVERAPT